MRIIADKGIAGSLAAALARLALKGKGTPRRYLVEVDKAENTVLIAKRSESAMEGAVMPLNFRYQVLMDDVL